jgi:ATP-dependent RNA helicase RhlE
MCAFGGVDIKPQIAELKKGVEILVATPGRLLDHVENKSVSFNSVQALVLDEADRMLDMGFVPDVTRILNMLPAQRQSLLFSATFSEEIKKLADTMLKSPVLIEVARRNQVSDTITHRVHPVSEYGKRGLLTKLLRSGEIRQAIVFMRTKQGCSRLTRELQRAGIKADAIHGDKSQLDRIKALEAFKGGETHALIATDVAARGLDVDDLPYVINYELPHTPEDYVHRIGRTGRAGKMGNAISLVSAREVCYLVDIEKLIKRPIEQVEVVGFEPEPEYEYPPGNKKRRSTPPVVAPVAQRPERGERPERSERSSRPERGERNDRQERRPRRNPMIAADGFDFSKPYEDNSPRGEVPDSPQAPAKADPHKPKRVVAALLGGLGRK